MKESSVLLNNVCATFDLIEPTQSPWARLSPLERARAQTTAHISATLEPSQHFFFSSTQEPQYRIPPDAAWRLLGRVEGALLRREPRANGVLLPSVHAEIFEEGQAAGGRHIFFFCGRVRVVCLFPWAGENNGHGSFRFFSSIVKVLKY
jgi:hypothetical protein